MLSLSACKDEKKCRFGTPKAIFSPQMKGVTNHQFQLTKDINNNNSSIESVLFSDGQSIAVVQSGCDKLLQAYTFTLKGNFELYDPDKWIKEAIQQLNNLAHRDPALASLGNWSQAIEQVASSLKLGQPLEIQAGINIKIDKIKSPDSVALIIELTNG